jgi:hypothetical protein
MMSMPEFPLIFEESWDFYTYKIPIDNSQECGSGSGMERCFAALEHHFAEALPGLDHRIGTEALSGLSDQAQKADLEAALEMARRTYAKMRATDCDALARLSEGRLAVHATLSVRACRMWLDMHRRSLLRETVGEAPPPIIDKGRGPYRMVDVWRRAGVKRQKALRRMEAQSRERLKRARTRVWRVLDDWEEDDAVVAQTDESFRKSLDDMAAYRAAQCDVLTPKLISALRRGVAAVDAAAACRILVNREHAAFLREQFKQQPLISVDRKRGECCNAIRHFRPGYDKGRF